MTSVFADILVALVDLVEVLADLRDTVEHGP